MAEKYDDLPADSNMRQLPGWGRVTDTAAPLVPKWAGQFDTFGDWLNRATTSLTGAVGSVGQDVPAICVDALGRRCNVGRDFQRARDEGAFPVRYFWECSAEPTPEREALLAVEYAANHIEFKDEAGEFIADFVANDLPDVLATWTGYAEWRAARL